MNGRTNVTLLGNLTRGIELQKTSSGKSVAKFAIAVNHTKDDASFIDCVAWESTAEFLSKYAQKGQSLYLEGVLKQNRWQDKDGNNRSRLEVVVRAAEIVSRSERTEAKGDVVPDDVDEQVDLNEIPF